MSEASVLASEPFGSGCPATATPDGAARLRRLVDTYFDFIWRSLRRLGVPEADADDAAQQVFLVVARKLPSIDPNNERSFLFGTALRVASDARRARRRRREDPTDPGSAEPSDNAPGPEDLVAQRRARALLDEVLETMPLDLQTVFVLFELEELPTPDIASLLGIPVGTVASRLRRAREEFQDRAKRLQARYSPRGGSP
ncbi:MAG: sigma-70 family RNA polymerase sigma factor [Polyangiaceae bacterium]|nr:sigma-70 family RNA polymerase sigma factor [Polyangiaceae bacterium]